MTEAEVFASCLALSHCHFLDTPYEGDPFSDELNSGASNVCHYCTIDTLLSIIEKQCLRFTDVRFLNDSTEFLEIIPLIEHVLTNGNYSSSFKQFFLQPSIIEDLKSYRQSYSAISNVDQTYKDMLNLNLTMQPRKSLIRCTKEKAKFRKHLRLHAAQNSNVSCAVK